MNYARPRLSLLWCFLLLAFAFHASAQQATIVGTVTDPTGAVIPSVAIKATLTSTGQDFNTISNVAGQYVLPSLPNGSYDIKAESVGFKTFEEKNVVVNVGDRARVDIALQVGQTKESVNVEATALQVQSDSGEISEVITGNQVLNLATNGRNMVSLAELMPGVSSNINDFNGVTPNSSSFALSFNGQRIGHNVWIVDGGEDYDRGSGGKFSIMPSQDSISEFRELSSNYAAEYGLGSGATLSMVFKSGTRDFHGSAWEFFRNDKLDAGNFFTNSAGAAAPELRLNVFGFNFGGPVILPHYNKARNKTFFFYNQEWRRYVQGGAFSQQVPNSAMANGAIPLSMGVITVPTASQLSPAELSRFTSLGLVPGQPFPNNTIPASLISPAATAFLATGALPAPNTISPSGVPEFVGGAGVPTYLDEEILRVDHQFSDKFRLFGHFVLEHSTATSEGAMWSGDSNPPVTTVFANPSYSAVVHATNVISPNVVNEVAFNYNGNSINIVPGGIYQRTTAFNPPRVYSDTNSLNRLPEMNFQGAGINNDYTVSNWPWTNQAEDYQIREDLSWSKGRHNYKFGFGYMLFTKAQEIFGQTQGGFNFNGTYTGDGFGDFLLGYAHSYSELAYQDSGHWRDNSFSAYAQDTWRVNNRLTLNYGVRWEGIPHTYEENNRLGNFYPNLYNPANAPTLINGGNDISPSSPGLGSSPNSALAGIPFYLNGIGITGVNGIPQAGVQNHWNNWAPRLGFAYDLTGDGKTILRGGFGTMYERVQGNDEYNMGANPPFSGSASYTGVYLSNPTVSLLTGTAPSSPIPVSSISGLSFSNYKNPVSYQWSVGVERELWRGAVFSASYVGNQDRHQNAYVEMNDVPLSATTQRLAIVNGANPNLYAPYLGFGSIKLSENAQNSKYNAFQTELRIRATKGLTLQVTYTYSRAYDENNGGQNIDDLQTISNPYNLRYDYGPSGLDRTNIFLADYVYQLPFFRTSSNAVAKTLLGGWQLSGVIVSESGLPLNVTLAGANSSAGLGNNATNRPDLVGSINYPGTIGQWFNTSAFAAPALGTFGDLGHNAIRGPGRTNLNTSLFKDFSGIKWWNPEGATVQFRFETFNTLNHTQFQNPNTTFGNGNFGVISSAFDPRVLQLAAKLIF
ncbi:MAG TPA: carboxypeptidase regulatory-like domain-containing protein [Bryobacteraceae bacterium]|nr:carboxypeptidase regulatory-like domain-containing protein [Bryobacteraceae bacterium]